ncbi:hypothetical protein QEJ31_08415 [Pigmentibacter sp. JX0631]|uniref:hypothetical protein n=1 Tax=Pigmentibacter sp. JX0631 TaxID=2976982 RepID=UPI0024698A08|nr:hypothetical protein [Pigmentibacter sp. JX0631]WGL58560.1 hypothetical protein QEJ31_08415 [Pigmentibacter sp. JX0631]
MNESNHNFYLNDKKKQLSPEIFRLVEINKKNKYKYLLNILLKKNSINREKILLKKNKQ